MGNSVRRTLKDPEEEVSYHIMTDIETLSSQVDAAVIAIGLCCFKKHEIVETCEILIDPVLASGHRDPKTIDWWRQQDPVVQQKMFSGENEPWRACDKMAAFIKTYEKHLEGFWANPPQFDIVILRQLFDTYGKKFPVHFRKERDFRTLKSLAHAKGIDYQSAYEGINKHDAVDDAVAQAKAVQIIMRALS
jgi:hypothetical protein